MKRIAWILLLVFLSFIILVGCSVPPIEAKQDEPQKTELAEAEKEKEEPVKIKSEIERRIDQIRSSLVERGLMGANDRVYRLEEEIDPSGRTYTTPFGERIFQGFKYYVVLPRIRYKGEEKVFHLGVNLFGEIKEEYAFPRFPLGTNHFGILVGDEIINLSSRGIATGFRDDLKKNTRYNLEGDNRKIIEKLREPTDVVLFSTIVGKTDVIIILKEEIDWDAW